MTVAQLGVLAESVFMVEKDRVSPVPSGKTISAIEEPHKKEDHMAKESGLSKSHEETIKANGKKNLAKENKVKTTSYPHLKFTRAAIFSNDSTTTNYHAMDPHCIPSTILNNFISVNSFNLYKPPI